MSPAPGQIQLEAFHQRGIEPQAALLHREPSSDPAVGSREAPRESSAAHEDHMEPSRASGHPLPEAGERDLALAHPYEHERSPVVPHFAATLNDRRHPAQSQEHTYACKDTGEAITEIALDTVAPANEEHIGPDRAGIDEQLVVDVPDVHGPHLAGTRYGEGLIRVGGNSMVAREMVERSAGEYGEGHRGADQNRRGRLDGPVAPCDQDAIHALGDGRRDLFAQLFRRDQAQLEPTRTLERPARFVGASAQRVDEGGYR